MKEDQIFLLDGEGQLQHVPQADYDSEALLQTLIADHPELLAGSQIAPDNPVRWLLVRREAGIPRAAGSGDHWSVDHLLLDQTARPTFVEVKRSTDPRIRREVVAQMLDYAANAQAYWPADKIRALAAEQYGGVDRLNEQLLIFLTEGGEVDHEVDIEQFWQRVEENLRTSNVRLLFVADEIPSELKRVIEFLNEEMPRIEVLGVEIRRYQSGSMQALVPRLVGLTERARVEKKAPARKTTQREFLEACMSPGQELMRSIVERARDHGAIIEWGARGFSLRALRADGRAVSLAYGFPPGVYDSENPFLQVYLGYIREESFAPEYRKRFLEDAPFREKGEFTLELPLTSATDAAARKVIPILWELVRSVANIAAEANAETTN